MTGEQAKEILLLHRPGERPESDPEVTAALRLLASSPELAAWYERQQQLHHNLCGALRSIEPPPGLRERILARVSPAPKIVRLPVWRRHPVGLALAAALALFGLLAALWDPSSSSGSFENFRARMISEALRQYVMELETNDMPQVRQLMESRGAPADYQLTPGLLQVELAGGGVLTWRGRPVAMVCFKRGTQDLIWMFVMNAAGLSDVPPSEPRIDIVREVSAASWSKDGKVYVLAGPTDVETLKRLL